MKKVTINSIVEHSNSQRTFVGDTVKIGGFNYSSEPSSASNKNNLGQPLAVGSGKLKPALMSHRSNALATSSSVTPYRNIALMMNNPNVMDASGPSSDIDFKIFQFKKQQAELNRNQLESDLKENHPYFDKVLVKFNYFKLEEILAT